MIKHEDLNNHKIFMELSTSQLIETYELAIELNLSIDFQRMLAIALKQRLSEQLT